MFKKSLKLIFTEPLMVLPLFICNLLGNARIPVKNQIVGYGFDINSIIRAYSRQIMVALLLMVVLLFISPFLTAWTNLMVKDKVLSGKIDFNKNSREAFKYYVRVLVVSLALIAALIIYIFLSIFIIGSLYVASKGSAGVFIIGILIFVLILGFVAILVTPVIPILVVEDEGFTGAFKRSFEFGFSNFFNILGVFVFNMIIGLLVGIIFKNVKIIQTLINSYMSTLLTVYIINKYIEEYIGFDKQNEVQALEDSTTLE
ncbi:hypothetical protein [Caloramator proteoclasticus]|uniref:DUF7847 domain-containing protein n=1 Tax=Caloramator proteoclasticus DSM 10124 TaxID=1121262 RepID=A0A1M5AY07_9CLOT|nr:hypothetical protein [Caloramator proteoclasticus]SHF35171.1 hypothetical protein SAMN02746091_02318 [Caloramator proteoclasticus DSM 10124]